MDVYEPSFSFRTLRDRSAARRQDAAAVWYQLLGERIVYENAAGALVTWEP